MIVKFENITKYISMISFPVAGVIYMGLAILYGSGNKIAIFADKLLTTRISLTNAALNVAKPTFMGTVVKFEPLIGGVVDSLYPYCLLKYGYIWLIILSIFFFMIAKKGNIKDCIIILLFSLFSCCEHMTSFVFFGGILILTKIYEPYEISIIPNTLNKVWKNITRLKN